MTRAEKPQNLLSANDNGLQFPSWNSELCAASRSCSSRAYTQAHEFIKKCKRAFEQQLGQPRDVLFFDADTLVKLYGSISCSREVLFVNAPRPMNEKMTPIELAIQKAFLAVLKVSQQFDPKPREQSLLRLIEVLKAELFQLLSTARRRWNP